MGIALDIVALLVGLYLLERGADYFTDSVRTLARRLRAPESVVGLLTAGGEWEELVVVALALVSGHPGIAAGNIIGSCIANLAGSMPLGLLGKQPLRPDRSARIYAFVMLGATVVASAFLFGGRVTPFEGGVLLALFVLYTISVLLVIERGWLRPPEDEEEGDDEENEGESNPYRLIAVLTLSLIVISGGAELVVQGAIYIAQQAGLSEYAIGATVVAVGTTISDKAISLIGGLRGQGGIVTANATGSNIFLLTLVLGLAALTSGSGLSVAPSVPRVDTPILLAVSVLVVLLFQKRTLHRRSGLALLAIYIGYIAYQLVSGT